VKTFRQFITEGTATEIKELIFTDDQYEYPIPFSQPMWERITNAKREGYGMHVTDQEDVVGLAKMQGKKNQISTMTDMRGSESSFVQGGGILTEGGIYCVLKGTVVMEMGEDFATVRDTQGRRWLRTGQLYQRHWHSEVFEGWMDFVNDIQQMRQKGYEQIIQAQNQNPELQKHYGVTVPDYDTPEEYWRSDNIQSWTEISDYGTGKEKAGAIKWYMDGIEEILKNKKHLEQIQKMLTMGKRSGDQMEWDELVLSEIKILKVIYHPSKVYSKSVSHLDYDAKDLISSLKKSGYKGPIVKMGDKGGFLRDEMQQIKNLNGRIVLNAKMGKNFPTKYKV
tara:strand:+ start:492 stop:1502 length:1011 start_codon:yes stop_codon:yes gene_type:complete